jgi:thiol-disulfide isomerase/thioredoxin
VWSGKVRNYKNIFDMSENVSDSSEAKGSRLRNVLVALGAIATAVALFFSLQTETSSFSLDTQAENSTPLEIATSNGKPTLLEFYANWCTSCQAMAKDLGELKQEYDNVNFVMLNVDNSKWLPEMLRHRVDGIPHFVFLDREGEAIAQTIGEQPRSVLQANLDALVASRSLPYSRTTGQSSQVEAPTAQPKASPDEPRSHGSPVN